MLDPGQGPRAVLTTPDLSGLTAIYVWSLVLESSNEALQRKNLGKPPHVAGVARAPIHMTGAHPTHEVSLYLKGIGLNPDELTGRLGIAPTRAHKKGETWMTSTGKQVVERTGQWVLTIRSSDDLSASLGELVAMTGRDAPLSELPGVDEAYFDIFVAVDADDRGGGSVEFEMSVVTAVAIGKLALPVQFSAAVIPK